MPLQPPTAAPFLIRFASASPAETAPAAVPIGLPVLTGPSDENLFPPGHAAGSTGAFALQQSGDWLLGSATRSIGPEGIDAVTRALYDDLLTAVRGRHVARVWNYVPQINAHASGQENYRAFCRGRALAFETEFGAGQFSRLCAASAVGTPDHKLSILFAAASMEPRHFENPAQTPAYRYPPEHGPRSPSFARATASADGRMVFVSGTSSIKGHSTVAPGDTPAQVACTLDNLTLISRTAGLGNDLGASAGWTRHIKIYLRHAVDLPTVSAQLQATFLRPTDHVIWLQADICRAELNVEIEATLIAN